MGGESSVAAEWKIWRSVWASRDRLCSRAFVIVAVVCSYGTRSSTNFFFVGT